MICLCKSKRDANHIFDLSKTYEILRHYKMKLNATKCTFDVNSCKFQGFMVNNRGIEANSENIQALQNLKLPTNLKELQTLTDRLLH